MTSDIYTSTDSLIIADVDVLTPGMDCEPATVVGKEFLCSNRHCIPMKLHLTISTASCSGYSATTLDNDSSEDLGYYGSAQHLKCNETVSRNKVDKLVFSTAHWNGTSSVDKFQAVSCTPTYNMTRQLVSVDISGQMRGFCPSPSSETAGQHVLNIASLSPINLAFSSQGIHDHTLHAVRLGTEDTHSSHFEPFFYGTKPDQSSQR